MNTVPGFTLSKLPTSRRNVLDLISIVAKPTIPAYLFCDVNMEEAEALRVRLLANGFRVTVTALLLKSIAIAQLFHPRSRTLSLPSGRFITLPHPIAGFTVERLVDNQPAVFFGVIHQPHTKPLQQIAKEIKAFAENDIEAVPQLRRECLLSRVPWLFRQIGLWFALRIPLLRTTINPATFGLSTLGKFGLRSLAGPCVSTCIFGVGAVELRPAAIDGKVVAVPTMTLSLSVDTRVMNIERAAHFMSEVKKLMESALAGHLDQDPETTRELQPTC